MIRKIAMQIGIPILLVFIAVNAYFVGKHLKQVQSLAPITLESFAFQAKLTAVLTDVTDMETGQRGYLLTDDSAYLQPYTDAKGRITADLASLHSAFSNRSQNEQSLESKLESLAASKQDEIERTISLRQQGYRRRSFNLVDTNEGKGYMDEIRRIVSSLSSVESNNLARFEIDSATMVKKIWSQTILLNSGLFLLAVFLFWLILGHVKILAEQTAKSKNELTTRGVELERLTSALSGQVRSSISAIDTNSHLLLENFGSFLPRKGREYAEQMKEAAEEMERIRQDLVGAESTERAA